MLQGRERLAAFVVAAIALTVAPVIIEETPVAAAVPTTAPTGLTPNGTSSSGNPVLGWNRLVGATRYRVQVSVNSAFSSTVVNEITFNRTYTPKAELATGTLYWRVAGMDATGSGQGPWSSVASVTKGLEAPTPQRPANGAEIDYKDNPVTFAWTPTRAAFSYVLEYDDAADFVGATKVVTRSTSYTAPRPLIPGTTYYWRVRGSSKTDGAGILTVWSPAQSFVQRWEDRPQLTNPADGAVVTDTELRWNAVPGAVYYNVEVSTADTFSAPFALRVTNGRSLAVTWKESLPNAAYWWRVQSVDTRGNLGPWSAVRQFTRNWIAQPTLLSPDDGAATNGNLLVQWSSVDHASEYVVQFSPNATFTSGVSSCTTRFTRIVAGGTDCAVTASTLNSTFYWRVRGVDRPAGIAGVYSTVRSIAGHTRPALPGGTFDPAVVPTRVFPADCTGSCAFKTTPMFGWAPTPGATSYRLTIAVDPNFTTIVDEFALGNQTVFQPTSTLRDTNAGEAFYWYVQACGAGGCNLSPKSQHPPLPSSTFSQIASPVELLWPAPASVLPDIPTFVWTNYLDTTSNDAVDPFPGTSDLEARHYHLQVSTRADFANTIDDVNALDQNFYTPWNKTYPEGQIYWRVRAYDGSNRALTWSPTQTYTKSSPAPQRVAPVGNVSGDIEFKWTRVLGGKQYDVEIYKNGDKTFSPANRVRNIRTDVTAHTFTSQLPPGEYAMRMLRLDADDRLSEWSHLPGDPAVPTFRVVEQPVNLVAPANNAVVGEDLLLLSWSPQPGATKYTVQRSVNADFSSAVTSVDTIMNSFAPTEKIAMGTHYWRVISTNANGEVIGTSATRSFRRDVLPNQVTGVSASRGDSTATVRWTKATTTGSAITGYRIYPYLNDSATPLAATSVGPNATSVVINGLVNGSRYRFRVAAISAAGEGTRSALTNEVVPSPGPSLPPGTVYVPIKPCRVVDTRKAGGALRPDAQRVFQVAGSGERFKDQGGVDGGCGIPAGALGAELSVTAVSPTDRGFFRAWPANQGMPAATFLNFAKGKSITNTGAMTLATAANEQLRVRNSGSTTHYVLDVQGYFADPDGASADASVYVPITPCRIVDTRLKGGALAGGVQRAFAVTGSSSAFANQGGKSGGCGLPAGATAIEASVTAVGPSGPGYFRAWPNGETEPTATFLNYVKGESTTNTGAIKVATSGSTQLRVRNHGATSNYVVDIQGYFVPAATADIPPGTVYVPITPCRIVDTRLKGGPLAAGTQRAYAVTGSGAGFANQGGKANGCGIPAGAKAIEASLSAIGPSANGYARVWPANEGQPNATFLNMVKGQPITNTGAIKIAPSGTTKIRLLSGLTSTNYVIDIQGYYQ